MHTLIWHEKFSFHFPLARERNVQLQNVLPIVADAPSFAHLQNLSSIF